MSILTLDVGGTAIKSGLVNADGSFISSAEHVSDSQKGGPFLMERICEVISTYHDYEKIGVSVTGQVNSKEGIIVYANDNVPNFTGTKVRDILAAQFHVPVYVENDVNAAALGEAYYGAGKDYTDFLCLTYGTGIGGAIIINRNLYKGAQGIAGEFGHIVIHANGLKCGCDLLGCYEQYASTKALVRNAMKVDSSYCSGRVIFDNLRASNDRLQEVVDNWVDEIVLGLASLTHIFNPPCIILGGGIMNEQYLLSEISKKLKQKVMESYRKVVIKKALLGNKAGMLGALQITL